MAAVVLSQQGGVAEGSLIRVVPGRAGAALTKPGPSVLPDGAGPASVAERSTRGTGALRASGFGPGWNLADVGRARRVPPFTVAAGTSGRGT